MCGIIGVRGGSAPIRHVVNGLGAIQNRGSQSCGIAAWLPPDVLHYRGSGTIPERIPGFFFDETQADVGWDKAKVAIGHVRYATQGSVTMENAAPFWVRSPWREDKWILFAHNGDIPDIQTAYTRITERGYAPQGTSDGEIMAADLLWHHSKCGNWIDAITAFQAETQAAYSLVFLTSSGELYAARDPWGVRPMCLGRIGGDTYVVASESAAIERIGGCLSAIPAHGAIVQVTDDGFVLHQGQQAMPHLCGFEAAYLANPRSQLFGPSNPTVLRIRRRLGARLGELYDGPLDVVAPVPNSGIDFAIGLARAKGVVFDEIVIRDLYTLTRSFQQTSPAQRAHTTQEKLWIDEQSEWLQGATIALVDDSIVRGTVSREVIRSLRQAGAAKIYFFSAWPPFRHPCHLGVDARADLIASNRDVEQIRSDLGADGLFYLEEAVIREEYRRAGGQDSLCMACVNGQSPIPVPADGSIHTLDSHEQLLRCAVGPLE